MTALSSQDERGESRELADRALFESAPLGLAQVDGEGRFMRVNRALARLTGYSRDELLGTSIVRLSPPAAELDEAGAWALFRRQTLETGARVHTLIQKGGKLAACRVHAARLDERAPELAPLVLTFEDVTERELVELKRRKLFALVERSHDFIATADLDGTLTYLNAAGRRMVGLPDERDPQDVALTEYVAERWRPFYREQVIATTLQEGFWEGELQLRQLATGQLLDVLHTSLLIRDPTTGKPWSLATVTRDITNHKRAESALRESEERLRLMIAAVRDYAIFLVDPEGRISSWNLGAERLKGYRADEVIGKPLSIFYTEQDRARGHVEDELRRARSEGSYEEEGYRVRKSGELFWANVVITAIFDPSGRHLGFTKVTRDMTERRNAEERLRKLNEQLEQRVQQRTNELAATLRELETFSYSVSHDLRAPLRAMSGFSRLLLEQTAHKLDAHERDYLERIPAAAQRMSELIDALLMLSRLSRTPLTKRAVHVSALCEGIATELRGAEPAREVALSITPELTAAADEPLLRVLFENLLRNAWKFTRHEPHASIEVGQLADGQTFYVRDNGVGFDPALSSKLFQPFQRLHRERAFEGSGIGLATVYRIVERHGGRVWAESQPGAGATFFFTLGGAHES